jgi:hypothetical protein
LDVHDGGGAAAYWPYCTTAARGIRSVPSSRDAVAVKEYNSADTPPLTVPVTFRD